MVDIKELRIGNLVLAGIMTEPISVFTITYEIREGYFVNTSIPIGDLHPMPLTPEILLACGFEDMHGEFCPSYRKDHLEIEITGTECVARVRHNWSDDG